MSARDEVSLALDSLWQSSREELGRRISTIETAARAVQEGSLGESERANAQAAAHKLAGTLGTFGLAEGSQHAAELEHLFARGPRVRHGERMANATAALRRSFDSADSHASGARSR